VPEADSCTAAKSYLRSTLFEGKQLDFKRESCSPRPTLEWSSKIGGRRTVPKLKPGLRHLRDRLTQFGGARFQFSALSPAEPGSRLWHADNRSVRPADRAPRVRPGCRSAVDRCCQQNVSAGVLSARISADRPTRHAGLAIDSQRLDKLTNQTVCPGSSLASSPSGSTRMRSVLRS
jgi:hypothetical protein